MNSKSLKSYLLTNYMLIMILLISILLVFTVLSSPLVAVHINRGVYYMVLGIILVFLCIIFILFFKKVYVPIKNIENKMLEFSRTEDVAVEDIFTESRTILEQIDELLELQKSTMEQEHARAIMTQKMKYAELQNQINPHFLYNTLENIRGQAIVDENNVIADMTEALARYFRYNISKDNDIVKLSQELENIRTYIQIQQYRFKNRFTFQIYNHDDTDVIFHCQIPKMTLQPIVENAIFHGLENKIEQGHIGIHIEVADTLVTLLVEDDGVGMDAETLSNLNKKLKTAKKKLEWIEEKENSNGIALENVNNRLRLLYGENYGLNISSTQGVGTEVEISIPLLLDKERYSSFVG
jgi:two-component system sensor histidine kinase YesM